MINRMFGRQVLLVLMVAFVVYMGAGFVGQTVVGRQQREVLHGIESQIEAARQEQAALQAQLEYVQTPQSAEEWARENGWARPEEQLVIVVAPPAEPSAIEAEPAVEPPVSESIRGTWWELFFGDR